MRERRVCGVEFRLLHDGNVPDAAPALHFDEAVGLPLDGALLHGEAAGDGEDVEEVDGLVDDLGVVVFGQRLQAAAADVGPEGDEGEVVFDDGAGGHGGWRRMVPIDGSVLVLANGKLRNGGSGDNLDRGGLFF